MARIPVSLSETNTSEIEELIAKTMPLAIENAESSEVFPQESRSARAGLQFSIGKVHRLMKSCNPNVRALFFILLLYIKLTLYISRTWELANTHLVRLHSGCDTTIRSFTYHNHIIVLLAAVIEYLVADILRLACEATTSRNITEKHLRRVAESSEELNELLIPHIEAIENTKDDIYVELVGDYPNSSEN